MTRKPDLLIGISLGFSYQQVSGFIRSFRRFNQDARLILILGCINAEVFDEFNQYARKENVEIVTPKQVPGSFIQRANWRYFAYLDHLKNNEYYRNVMLSDVRDVFFQDDPFRLPLTNHVVCAAENLLIGQNRINAAWLYKAYGPNVVRAMAKHRVSCSGTTIGTYAGIRQYCLLMCEEINTHIHVESTDQAYHNYVYWNKNPGFMALDIEERFFNTVGSKTQSVFEINQERVRVDGIESIVVHQYDRHDSLCKHVKETYCLTHLQSGERRSQLQEIEAVSQS